MKRMQIQLPDKLYERLKRLAENEETSLAEILRRGAEYILSLHPEAAHSLSGWDIPEPMDLGRFRVAEEQWRIMANEADGSPRE